MNKLEELLLGEENYTIEDVTNGTVYITLPECTYEGTVDVYKYVYKRRRSPWTTREEFKCELSVPGGIPISPTLIYPEDNRTYSITLDLIDFNVENNINKWVELILTNRESKGVIQ